MSNFINRVQTFDGSVLRWLISTAVNILGNAYKVCAESTSLPETPVTQNQYFSGNSTSTPFGYYPLRREPNRSGFGARRMVGTSIFLSGDIDP